MGFFNKSRGFMFLGLLALASVFFFPIWEITMEAPQFPQGLSMDIWINQISGNDKHILQNINQLNHYIGMKAIEPDSIPELKYFPYVIYGMLGLGVLFLLINKKWGYLTWVLIMSILGLLGFYDFYLWVFDYGHNLDPSAPITIEDGSFMPPIFGSRQMANFYVTSYPDWGVISITLALLLGALAFWVKKRVKT